MYPAVLLMYFISAAVILLASLALTVQVSHKMWIEIAHVSTERDRT